MFRVKIKPLEPLLLRGPGEFDPFVRGTTSVARSESLPSPSTIAGLVISLLLKGPVGRAADWGGYVERMKELLSSTGVEWIRGPYFMRGESAYYPFLIEGRARLFEACGLLSRLSKLLEGEGDIQLFEDVLKELDENVDQIEPLVVQRVGTALTSRSGGKVVREGYLYGASLVGYGDAEIVVEVGARVDLGVLNNRVAVLGGEQRKVLVRVEAIRNGQNADSIAWLAGSFQSGPALLLSPLVLSGGLKNRIVLEGVGSSGGLVLRYGRLGVKGLGFSVLEKRRKPLYPLVTAGSILVIDKVVGDARAYGAYAAFQEKELDGTAEVLGRIGYGSFVPVSQPGCKDG
ncbi:MAG: type III-B CRISPR module-associated Cmr3 family protein [Infirmifilum sp.]